MCCPEHSSRIPPPRTASPRIFPPPCTMHNPVLPWACFPHPSTSHCLPSGRDPGENCVILTTVLTTQFWEEVGQNQWPKLTTPLSKSGFNGPPMHSSWDELAKRALALAAWPWRLPAPSSSRRVVFTCWKRQWFLPLAPWLNLPPGGPRFIPWRPSPVNARWSATRGPPVRGESFFYHRPLFFLPAPCMC